VKKIRFPTLLCALVFAGAPLAAEYKLAFVNAIQVVEQSPQYEAAQKELDKEFSQRNEEVVSKQQQLKKLQEKLERDGALMSESELKRLEKDIFSRQRKLKNAQEEFREDFALRRNELLNKLRTQVAEVVEEVAKDEKIDLVLSDGVVYFSKRVDISDKVVERLKEKFQRRK
jgi:outer membrane protein